MVYTTEELLQILEAERQACLRGDRLNLTGAVSSGHPLVDRFLKIDGLQKYEAFQGFKDAIHAYQRHYQVSGMTWQHVTIRGQQVSYPRVEPQLIALAEDLACLQGYQAEVVRFWQQVSGGMEIYLAVNHGRDFQRIESQEVEAIAQRTEWATIAGWERQDFLEIVLQLGWGDPGEADYWRAWPSAGSERVHAVRPGCLPICT